MTSPGTMHVADTMVGTTVMYDYDPLDASGTIVVGRGDRAESLESTGSSVYHTGTMVNNDPNAGMSRHIRAGETRVYECVQVCTSVHE